MADGAPLGRVVVDVDLDDAALRTKVKTAMATPFKAKVDFGLQQVQNALKEKVGSTYASSKLTAKVRVEFGLAQMQEELQKKALLLKPISIPVTFDKNQLKGATKDLQRFDAKRVADSKKTADKIKVIDAQASKSNAANIALRERLEFKSAERIERQQAAFRNSQLLAQKRLDNSLALIEARAQARLAAKSSKPLFLNVVKELEGVSGSLRAFDQTASRVLRTSLLSFTVWSAGVVLALGAVAAASIANFAKVEEAAVRAGSVFTADAFSKSLEKTGKGFEDFGKRATASSKVVIKASNEIALQTIFNPSQIAKGAQAFAQAGLSQQETLRKNADGFSNLAIATRFAQNEQIEIADATERLVGGLKAAGLETSDLTSLTDKFTQAANATNASALEIADAFSNQAAGAFNAYGQSVDSTIATIALFAKANLRGKEAGTQTAIVVREITNALTNKAPEAFKKYGIAIEDAQGKALPFEQTLVQFGKALENVRTKEGATGVARFRKELGLTERSLRGLIILSPQIAKLGPDGAAALSRSIGNSTGATARQSEALFNTISVQFGNFIESIGIQFQKIGEQAAPGFKDLIDQFNGPGGLFQQVERQSIGFGKRLGQVFRDVAQFVQTDDFREGISIFGDAIKITVRGVAEAFRQLGIAFGGVEDGESAFVGFAKTIRAFAQLSARVLPEVARIIGEVVNVLIENSDAFEVFAKAAVSVFLLNKAFTLFIAPIAGVTKAIIGLRGAFIASGLLGGEAAAGATIFTASLGSLAAGLAIVTGLAIGAFAAFQGLSEEFRKARENNQGFNNTLSDLSRGFQSFATNLGIAKEGLSDVGGLLFSVARGFGSDLGKSLVEAASALGGLVRSFQLLKDGQFGAALSELGDSAVDAAQSVLAAASTVPLLGSGLQRINTAIDVFQGDGDRLSSKLDQVAAKFIDGAIAAQLFSGAVAHIGTDNKGRLVSPFAAFDQTDAQKAAKSAAADAKLISDEISDVFGGGGAGGGASQAVKQLRNLGDEALAVVDKLSSSQAAKRAASLIGRIGNEGFRATRVQLELLKTAMPGLDKALEAQRKIVQGLDDALGKLKDTQLEGTKAFSDAAFSLEQDVKKLQLQRVDLIIGGSAEDSAAVEAIDAQIKAIQLQSEKLSLSESLQLDPLKRQLEDTFSPVTELSFDAIISQFKALTSQQGQQNAKLAEQERQQQLIASVIESSSAVFEKQDRISQRAAAAADAAAQSFGGVARQAGAAATGVTKFNTAATNVADGGKLVDGNLQQINERVRATAPRVSAAGVAVSRAFSRGLIAGAQQVVYPSVNTVTLGVSALLQSGPAKDQAASSGSQVMRSFHFGMQAYFNETIAPYLNKTIPERIRQLKGPVAYDATILVPAGEAVMAGFDKGLRSGFGNVENFLKDVGPSMEESVPDSVFIKRTANFMYEVSKGNTPDPYEYFKDLVPQTFTGSFSGVLDPALNFLHKTASVADTGNMAAGLAKLFGGGMQVTALKDNHNQFTSSGNISDHFFGTAADLSNGSSPTPEMDALAAALKPLYGTIVKQLIWRDKDQNRGFPVSGHMNHVHVAFLKAANFALDSGRIGAPALFDIPGASNTVDAAINAASKATGIDVKLLAAIAKQESRFNPRAISPAGAGGLFQLMPQTAAGLGVFNTFDPFANALGGAKYIKAQLKRFGSLDLALAAYNSGPGNVSKYGGVPPFSETINYIRNIKNFLREFGGSTKPFGGFRADGGAVRAGMKYMVNERGQEMLHSAGRYSMIRGGPQMLMPRSSGTVIDAETTRMLLDAAKGSGAKKEIAYSPTYKISTNTRDPRAVADVMDAKIRRQLQSVIM